MELNKYEIIFPHQINDFYKKGYEFISVYYEYNTYTNSSSPSLDGSIGGMNVTLNMSSMPGSVSSTATAKFLVGLKPSMEVLFGNNK